MKKLLFKLIYKYLLEQHRFEIGDLVKIGDEEGYREVSGVFYKLDLSPVYFVTMDGGYLREIKENFASAPIINKDDLR